MHESQSLASQLPLARTEQLLVVPIEGETLVSDLDNHKAHCLNPVAACVWQHCDGRTSIPAMAALVTQELRTVVDEPTVWLALHELGKARLLQERVVRPAEGQVTRRQLMRTAGAVAAAALVTSIVAPTAAQANSCLATGQPCTTGVQCCSNICNGSLQCV